MSLNVESTIIVGDRGLDSLWERIHEAWDNSLNFMFVWHIPTEHPEGIENVDPEQNDKCPRMVFQRQAFRG